MRRLIASITFCLFSVAAFSQTAFEDQLGAWYMYFWQVEVDESKFGFQGDVQFRNWNIGGDLEQLLLRGGATYKLTDNTLATLGYANITTGAFGDSDMTVNEHRIYQELAINHSISKRIKLRHRYRYEQRWNEDQDLRTRYRYNLFLTIPLQQKFYLSFYNELFVNGQREIDSGEVFPLFDRNRFYAALGYEWMSSHKIQLGLMTQKTNTWTKRQLQLSVHSNF